MPLMSCPWKGVERQLLEVKALRSVAVRIQSRAAKLPDQTPRLCQESERFVARLLGPAGPEHAKVATLWCRKGTVGAVLVLPRRTFLPLELA